MGRFFLPSYPLHRKQETKQWVIFKKNTSAVWALEKHVESQQSHGLPQMPKQSEEIAG